LVAPAIRNSPIGVLPKITSNPHDGLFFADTIGIFVCQLGLMPMMWFVIRQILSTLLEGLWLWRKTDCEKDLEILLLRRQLEIVNRARDKPLRVSRAEKLTLAVLAVQLKCVTGCVLAENLIREEFWHNEALIKDQTMRRVKRAASLHQAGTKIY
jgi:hypothetical protein